MRTFHLYSIYTNEPRGLRAFGVSFEWAGLVDSLKALLQPPIWNGIRNWVYVCICVRVYVVCMDGK